MRDGVEPMYFEMCSAGQAGRPVHHGGVDLVDGARLHRALGRYGERLRHRLFGAGDEIDPADADAVAGVFGIKESVVKAMGGLPRGGRLADIRVRPDGAVWLDGELAGWARERRMDLLGGYAALRPGVTLSWALAVPAGDGSRA